MEGSWVRSRTKKNRKSRSRRAAAAARLRRAVLQQQSRARHDQAGTSGTNKEGRRRGAAAASSPGTAAGRKFRELQTLVPGGEGLRADRLLLRTAGYILHLRRQVHLLRLLSELYNAP